MQPTPKSLRKSIVLVGRVNAGKSSLLNALTGQDVSIVSEIPGTTTDAVGKAYELIGYGPVTFYDTAGFDDDSLLAQKRQHATNQALQGADLLLLVVGENKLTTYEEDFIKHLKKDYLIVHTKADIHNQGVSSTTGRGIEELRHQIITKLQEKSNDNRLLTGLVNSKDKVLLVAPIDASAPAGRLILPQVQILRELLDLHAIPTVVQLEELKDIAITTTTTNYEHALIITDSRVVKEVVAILPTNQPLTTFSILFGRQKGDFAEYLKGAKKIDTLKDGDKILIAEACSHTTAEDDIAREVLPKLIKKYTNKDLHFEVTSGKYFPANLKDYALVLHCGSCMLTKTETNARINQCQQLNIPITNYGLAISKCQGVLERVIAPLKHQ